jgi:hypothetical protein
MSDSFEKYYILGGEKENWEGIFKTGGKREYTKYDKADISYTQLLEKNAEAMETLLISLRSELNKRGISIEELLVVDQDKKIQEYDDIARSMGVFGREGQKDVRGFIDMLLNRLISS